MTGWLLSTAGRLTRSWAAVYTLGLSDKARQTRRSEIHSDVWEQCAEAGTRGHLRAAAEIVTRLLLGMPDDILWRWENQMNESINRSSPWWMTATVLGGSVLTIGLMLAAGPLAASWFSATLQQSVILYPSIEVIHVISICVFVGFAALLDFRVLGLTLRRTPVIEMEESLLPWAMCGLALAFFSGALLYLSDPLRLAHNPLFLTKTALLLLAGANAWLCHRRVYRRAAEWDKDRAVPPRARIASTLSVVLWILILGVGRFTSYFQ